MGSFVFSVDSESYYEKNQLMTDTSKNISLTTCLLKVQQKG